MNFRVDRWSAVALRSSLVVLTAVSALLLSSCGGGGQSSQTSRFKPTRMIVFGDESSLLLPGSTSTAIDGRKYTNNGLSPGTTTIDCNANPIWVQRLAGEYGLVFAECNPGGATPRVQMRATAGGKVADVVLAVNAFLASTPGNQPVPTDMITMMVGTNDILELYDRVTNSANPAPLTQAAAVTEIQGRAELLAAQINRLTNDRNTLGRVMYSTVPRVSLTPFGRSQSPGDQTLLRLLTDSFNDRMRSLVRINGRSLGFLDPAQTFNNIVDDVNDGGRPNGIINVSVPVCTVAILSCDTDTLVSGGEISNYLWADDIRFSYAGHIYIGEDAIDLATSLPW
jgi:phospholipase/lecithinase/hemolysin